MAVSRSRKSKSSRSAGKASRSGNPARRAEQVAEREAERLERRVDSRRREASVGPFGVLAERRRALDRERMAAASRDAQPVIADLVSVGRSVSLVEDELCRRLGHVLAEQDAADDARRAAGAREFLESYSPDQLADALVDAVVLAVSQAGAVADEPVEREGLGVLLCALARIVPYPAAEIPLKAVADLRDRDRVTLPSAASVETSPTGSAWWCRNVYGTRFAITAPFAGADGPDRWYLWDVDTCGGQAYTVGSGYFTDAELALAAWRDAVGLETSAEAVLEPVADSRLAVQLLPDLPDFFHPGGESEAQYAEFHRSRRLAQELRRSDWLDATTGKTASSVPAEPVDKKAWIAEFAAWRTKQRPGVGAVPADFPISEGQKPLTEAELYRELADTWCSSELSELDYGCSPHRIALKAAAIRDFYTDNFATALLGLIPDVAAWLTERARLTTWQRGSVLSYAEGASSLDTDLGFRADNDLAALHE